MRAIYIAVLMVVSASVSSWGQQVETPVDKITRLQHEADSLKKEKLRLEEDGRVSCLQLARGFDVIVTNVDTHIARLKPEDAPLLRIMYEKASRSLTSSVCQKVFAATPFDPAITHAVERAKLFLKTGQVYVRPRVSPSPAPMRRAFHLKNSPKGVFS